MGATIGDGDLGMSELPIRRLPQIVSILYDVRTTRASEWNIGAQTDDLRANGFVISNVTESYDPKVGYKYEWWGYEK